MVEVHKQKNMNKNKKKKTKKKKKKYSSRNQVNEGLDLRLWVS